MSGSSRSSTSSSGVESGLQRLNRKLRTTFRKTWSLRKSPKAAEATGKDNKGRSLSDCGVYKEPIRIPDGARCLTPPLPSPPHHDFDLFNNIDKPQAPALLVEDQPSDSDGSSEANPTALIPSTGSFSSVAGFGLAGAGAATPLPPAQRSPTHKHDKNGIKPASGGEGEGVSPPPPLPPVKTSGRQKKFMRHFPQAAHDEKVLNYYSCALVGDILLQGHLYITKNYFAFYSNVFGYVTKLLIPLSSVVRVSKEKMARIIPNAVGVTTVEDKHVFASLLSRDSTFNLMTQVWQASPVPVQETIILPKELRLSKADMEASELSLDDESSWCSGSGGEGSAEGGGGAGRGLGGGRRRRKAPPRPIEALESRDLATLHGDVTQTISEASEMNGRSKQREEEKPPVVTLSVTRNKAIAVLPLSRKGSSQRAASVHGASMTNGPGGLSALLRGYAAPKHTMLLLASTALLVTLFLCATLLLYRIGVVSNNLSRAAHLEDNVLLLKRGDDIYSEILKWHSQLHSKSAVQVQDFLHSNLDQIAKARQSLETLSTLIANIITDKSKFPESLQQSGGHTGTALEQETSASKS